MNFEDIAQEVEAGQLLAELLSQTIRRVLEANRPSK
jgi:hypothetical protein